MYRKISPQVAVLALLLLALILPSCGAQISPYSPEAYKQATSLKVETITLMKKANEPYYKHAAEAETLWINIQKAYEFDKGRPKNVDSVSLWEIMMDKDGDLLGTFLACWRGDKSASHCQGITMSPKYIENMIKQVSDAFDIIIALESGKEKSQK